MSWPRVRRQRSVFLLGASVFGFPPTAWRASSSTTYAGAGGKSPRCKGRPSRPRLTLQVRRSWLPRPLTSFQSVLNYTNDSRRNSCEANSRGLYILAGSIFKRLGRGTHGRSLFDAGVSGNSRRQRRNREARRDPGKGDCQGLSILDQLILQFLLFHTIFTVFTFRLEMSARVTCPIPTHSLHQRFAS